MKQAAAFILLVALTFAAISGHAELPSVSDSVFGIYENDVYRNPYLGFGFRYEGWNFLTDAERERNKEINNRIRPLYSLEEDGGSGWRIMMSASLPGYTDAISVSCIHLGEHAAALNRWTKRN